MLRTGESKEKTPYLPIYIASGVSAAIFILGPMFVRRGPHQDLIRCSIMLTIFSLWLFWVTIYIAQMNPLLGPRMDNVSLAWVGYCWGEDPKKLGT